MRIRRCKSALTPLVLRPLSWHMFCSCLLSSVCRLECSCDISLELEVEAMMLEGRGELPVDQAMRRVPSATHGEGSAVEGGGDWSVFDQLLDLRKAQRMYCFQVKDGEI